MPLSNLKKLGIIFANWLNQSYQYKVTIFIYWTTNTNFVLLGRAHKCFDLIEY